MQMVICPIKGFLSSLKTKTLGVGYTFGLRRTQHHNKKGTPGTLTPTFRL